MTDTKKALERLRAANPLPADHVDADELGRFVSYFEERSDAMSGIKTVHRDESTKRGSRRFRPAMVFVTSLVAVLVVFGVAALLMPAEDSPVNPTTPVAETPQPTEAAKTTEAEEVSPQLTPADAGARVAAFHEAWNAGDTGAVLDALIPEIAESSPSIAPAIEGVEMKIHAVCQPATADLKVSCEVSLDKDLFYTPAGMTWSTTVVYQVTTSGIDYPEGSPFWVREPQGTAYDYLRAFDDWLFARHQAGQSVPTGWIWVDPDNGLLPNWADGGPCCQYSVGSVVGAREMVALVDEFLAQSEVYPPSIEITTEGSTTTGTLGGETVFTITHDAEPFAEVAMTREPNGTLTDWGWKSLVWYMDNDYTDIQFEIARLWPDGADQDIAWLTSYSGETADTLTGYTPTESEPFELYDALVLEGDLSRFGLHNDCSFDETGIIGAAVLDFSEPEPALLLAWVVDIDTRTFEPVSDLEPVQLGACVQPELRS